MMDGCYQHLHYKYTRHQLGELIQSCFQLQILNTNISKLQVMLTAADGLLGPIIFDDKSIEFILVSVQNIGS